MVVTNSFIYIHLPKTGGTFVTHILHQLHNRTIGDKLRQIIFKKKIIDLLKHETCSAIPAEFIDLPILSTVRNPYDRYVSQYEFKWWKKYPEQFANLSEWKENCSNFPDISFEEFVMSANKLFFQHPDICRQRNIGFHTEQFVLYYFKNPERILKQICAEYIKSQDYCKDIHDIQFIHTENLNRELYGYLFSLGYKKAAIEFILQTEKIFPVEGGRTSKQNWENYYTDDLKEFIRQKERYLFSFFPEYDS